jgi:hypothetical protein
LPIIFFQAHLDFPRTIAPLEQFRTPSTHSYPRRKKRQLKRHKIRSYTIFHFLRFWREFLLSGPSTYLFFRQPILEKQGRTCGTTCYNGTSPQGRRTAIGEKNGRMGNGGLRGAGGGGGGKRAGGWGWGGIRASGDFFWTTPEAPTEHPSPAAAAELGPHVAQCSCCMQRTMQCSCCV